ncbi:hypothetical protein F5884DRAFT_884648 [Xylogone sp. PMI_703]|nr:hypothetical protein F5884DRAFT_884648 [Xylogone sp. PMI_703]
MGLRCKWYALKVWKKLQSKATIDNFCAMVALERLYVSSPATAITSPHARLAQAFNLLGRIIQHCDDRDQDLAFMLEEMNTLNQATSALLDLTMNEHDSSYIATAVCFSALMKFYKNYLSDSCFQWLLNKANSHITSRTRENADRLYTVVCDTSLQILYFSRSIEHHIVVYGVGKLSPLILHCLYRAAFWLSYIADATQEDRFFVGRTTCHRVLNSRWKAAVAYLQVFNSACKEIEQNSS